MEKIFVSYAEQDEKYVQKVIESLKSKDLLQEDNFEIVDPHKDIKIDDNIRDTIQHIMKSVSKVIIIKSENSVASPWVNYEVGLADAFDKPIIVFEVNDSGEKGFLSYLADYQSFPLEKAV